ncbi:acyltransferase [Frondihabitans sp. VKM Ac-2883]|uniref:acyltransferase family protein n=1 Tax=Frondihabitans sp. VKM Ac-2883 TaxID=2783823 RepID=UPI00188A4A0B|nr:acyltransferase [Frondihabitans sp. VKM Ac-2883]MBF4576698.1 acyltransferase [Frondihabitans sp. VKM Ac-2883]
MGTHSPRHLTGLDGLRGLAALSVLAYHVSNILLPDIRHRAPELVFALHQGLNLFFVLSGFLLFLGFAERLVDGRELPSVGRYAVNRALRLWPAYATVFLVTNCVFGLSFVGHGRTGRVDPVSFVADLTLLQTLSPETIRSGLEVAWTLTVELTFYACLPLLAFAAARLGRRLSGWTRAGIPVVALAAIGAAGYIWQTTTSPHGWSHDWESVASRSLLVHAQLFALGMTATLLFVAVQRAAFSGEGRRILRLAALVVAIGAAVVCLAHRRSDLADTLAALSFAALLLVAVVPGRTGRPGLVGRMLDLPVLRGLGLISFGVYLWHMPVVRGLDRWVPRIGGGGWPHYLAAVALVGAVSVALATITYLVVERPAMRLRSRLSPRGPRSTPVREEVARDAPRAAAREALVGAGRSQARPRST